MKLSIELPQPRKELIQDIARPSRETSEARPDNMLWLDKNENMDVNYINQMKHVLAEIPASSLFGYPDCYSLYHKLALHLRKDINELFIAAGSDGIIRAVFETFISPGDTVIYTEPTFAMYALYATMYGAKPQQLHYAASEEGPQLTVDTVMTAIQNSRPRLVCLPNPNSPSGTVFVPAELRQIIAAAAEVGAVILIDEAYYPFYPETAMDWIDECPYLIIARTFSKAWGHAGIRLGYGIASPHMMQQLHKIRPMYEAGALSLAVAERLLGHVDAMLHSVQRLNAGKLYFIEQMTNLGLKCLPSAGNFFHVAFASHADAVHQRLANKVLYRKNFSHPSLSGYSRFTATTKEAFLPIINEIREVVK